MKGSIPKFNLGDKVCYWDAEDGCVSSGSVEKITITSLCVEYSVAGAPHALRERSLYTDAETVRRKYARDLLQIYRERMKMAEWRAREYAGQAETYRKAIEDLCKERGIELSDEGQGDE